MTTKKPSHKGASKGGSTKAQPMEFLSREARVAAGKALRGTVPRESQAQWTPSEKGRDPIEVLEKSNRDRVPELVPIRYGRMLR